MPFFINQKHKKKKTEGTNYKRLVRSQYAFKKS